MTPEEAVKRIEAEAARLETKAANLAARGKPAMAEQERVVAEALRVLLAEQETLEASEGVLMAKLQTAEQRAEAAEARLAEIVPQYEEVASLRARLREVEAERDALQHRIDCAKTPLMADVQAEAKRLRERLRQVRELMPRVLDALESDAKLRQRRAVFEAIQDLHEPGAALAQPEEE